MKFIDMFAGVGEETPYLIMENIKALNRKETGVRR